MYIFFSLFHTYNNYFKMQIKYISEIFRKLKHLVIFIIRNIFGLSISTILENIFVLILQDKTIKLSLLFSFVAYIF